MTSRRHTLRALCGSLAVVWLIAVPGCGRGAGDDAARASGHADPSVHPSTASPNRIVQLLAAGEPVLGVFSGEHTAEQATAMAGNRETDFVFFSLEDAPFDIESFVTYRSAMSAVTAPDAPRPLAVRIPAVKNGRDAAESHVRAALDAGADAIVFPHMGSGAEAMWAVRSMGKDVWPADRDGKRVSMFIVEDQEGLAHVGDIVGTPGVGIVFAGPGDLKHAYDGDVDAVERAIQSVLTACREFDVPCGITAGVKDIAMRLHQGFRVIIVLQPEALAVGRDASGRN